MQFIKNQRKFLIFNNRMDGLKSYSLYNQNGETGQQTIGPIPKK